MHETVDDARDREAAFEDDAVRLDEVERMDRIERDEGTVVAVVGEPDDLAHHWHRQDGPGDCAIYAEGGALEAFDKEFDPERERQAGEREGTYSRNGGTDIAALGHVWERNGIAVDRYPPSGSTDAVSETARDQAFHRLSETLEQRKGVVVAVDSGPLWHDEAGPAADRGHALWVTGLEQRESGATYVVCNDSGALDGQARRYPIEDFDRAWRRSGYDMVTTHDSLPEHEKRT